MFVYDFDPITTELVFKNVSPLPATATFTEFYVTQDLTLTQGTVAIIGFIQVDSDVFLTIDGNSVMEIV
mgnify:CR=1 FL=1